MEARDSNGHTVLLCAAYHRSTRMIKQLLPAADLSPLDLNGYTPLSLAVQAGHISAVRALLSAGKAASLNAIIDKPDAVGRTPLFLAMQNGALKIVQLLLKYGSDAIHT
ncbi:ankyrin repeat-containing domain protein [Aspergillus carlsbadensis]|nr:ankyrin repeat-containing domain protein [Aspergillus carlsbadensis]